MPTLSETQTPLLERDIRCNLVPERFGGEGEREYYIRLSQLYGLPVEEVVRVMCSR